MPQIENDTGEIRDFLIPVTWQMSGQFVVRARTKDEAVYAVENNDERFPTGRANGEYVDDSFEVNKDRIDVLEEKDMPNYADDHFVDLTEDEEDDDE